MRLENERIRAGAAPDRPFVAAPRGLPWKCCIHLYNVLLVDICLQIVCMRGVCVADDMALSDQSGMVGDAILLARRLIRIPSLTPVSADLAPAAETALDCVQAYLERHGAVCHRLKFEGGDGRWGYPVDNLYATLGGDAAFGHLCFLGHTDVVAPGDLRQWGDDPFSGEIRAGFLHGRGATDMKGAVAAFCAAAAHDAALAAARSPSGRRPRISLIITTDEEWAAVNGTRRVLEWLRANGEEPSLALVGEASSPLRFGTHIKVGRRGSLCGVLRARGTQGHAAYPDLYRNPNRALALALAVLHAWRWDDALPGMCATGFEAVALASGDFRATAIIPGQAEALWNIRFTSRQTTDSLMSRLRSLLADPPDWARGHPDAGRLADIDVIGNVETASMPYYSPPGVFARLVADAIAAETGTPPLMDATGGTTDGRFVHVVFPHAEIVEFGLPESGGVPPEGAAPEAGRGGMHQIGERCSLTDLAALTRSYATIIQHAGECFRQREERPAPEQADGGR